MTKLKSILSALAAITGSSITIYILLAASLWAAYSAGIWIPFFASAVFIAVTALISIAENVSTIRRNSDRTLELYESEFEFEEEAAETTVNNFTPICGGDCRCGK